MTSRTKMMEETRGCCIIMILFLEEKSQRKLMRNNMTKRIVIGAVTDDVTDHVLCTLHVEVSMTRSTKY